MFKFQNIKLKRDIVTSVLVFMVSAGIATAAIHFSTSGISSDSDIVFSPKNDVRVQGNVYANNLPVDVHAFGAKGDGINDDTKAIQAALDSLPPRGGIVYLPPGT